MLEMISAVSGHGIWIVTVSALDAFAGVSGLRVIDQGLASKYCRFICLRQGMANLKWSCRFGISGRRTVGPSDLQVCNRRTAGEDIACGR